MAHCYLLECSDGSLYVGSTVDLEWRVWEHNEGLGAKRTATRRPVRLVWCEFYDRVEHAFAREKQIRKWSRAKRLALIADRAGDLPALAECRRTRLNRERRELGEGAAG